MVIEPTLLKSDDIKTQNARFYDSQNARFYD